MSLQFIMGNSGPENRGMRMKKILAEAARHPEKKLSDRRAGAVYDADAERTRVSASGGRNFKY